MDQPVAEVLARLEAPLVAIATLLVIRLVAKRVLSSLAERGVVSPGAREGLLRVLDAAVILAAFLVVAAQFVELHVVAVALGVVGLLLLVVLAERVRGFMAYLEIRMDREIGGEPFEILLEGFEKPLRGRIKSVSASYSVIEDVYGRAYLVPTPMLRRAVLRPRPYSVELVVRIKHSGGLDVGEVAKLLAGLEAGALRIDEKRVVVESASPTEVVIRVEAHPLSMPIRPSDASSLVLAVADALRKHGIEAEVRLAE